MHGSHIHTGHDKNTKSRVERHTLTYTNKETLIFWQQKTRMIKKPYQHFNYIIKPYWLLANPDRIVFLFFKYSHDDQEQYKYNDWFLINTY